MSERILMHLGAELKGFDEAKQKVRVLDEMSKLAVQQGQQMTLQANNLDKQVKSVMQLFKELDEALSLVRVEIVGSNKTKVEPETIKTTYANARVTKLEHANSGLAVGQPVAPCAAPCSARHLRNNAAWVSVENVLPANTRDVALKMCSRTGKASRTFGHYNEGLHEWFSSKGDPLREVTHWREDLDEESRAER